MIRPKVRSAGGSSDRVVELPLGMDAPPLARLPIVRFVPVLDEELAKLLPSLTQPIVPYIPRCFFGHLLQCGAPRREQGSVSVS